MWDNCYKEHTVNCCGIKNKPFKMKMHVITQACIFMHLALSLKSDLLWRISCTVSISCPQTRQANQFYFICNISTIFHTSEKFYNTVLNLEKGCVLLTGWFTCGHTGVDATFKTVVPLPCH